MRKRIIGLVMAVLLVMGIFAGCGSRSASPMTNASAVTSAEGVQFGAAKSSVAPGVPAGGNAVADEAAPAAPGGNGSKGVDSLGGGTDVSQEVNNAILAERKIIRSANITVEVDNFDEAYGKINNLILGIGFIQETNINTERVYVNDKQKLVKKGMIVLRVDKNKFDSILNSLKGIGDVFNWTINGQDVTDKYIDVESRLRLLNLEESRLEEYLKKLTDLDQIFKTESRLTDIRQEIESLTGNLKKMSDLVDLSTITINMNEKYPDAIAQQKPVTYWQKLLNNLLDSSKGVLNFLGELVIILVAALPVLLLLGLLVLLAIFIYKRIPKRYKGLSSAELQAQKASASKEPLGRNQDVGAGDGGKNDSSADSGKNGSQP